MKSTRSLLDWTRKVTLVALVSILPVANTSCNKSTSEKTAAVSRESLIAKVGSITMVPVRDHGDVILTTAEPNPIYSKNHKGNFEQIGIRSPTVEFYPSSEFKILQEELVDHLIGHRVGQVKVETPRSPYSEHLIIDWSHQFGVKYNPNEIVEGQRAHVLRLKSPDGERTLAYVDLGGDDIVNRVWLAKGNYVNGEEGERVIDCTDEMNYDRPNTVAQQQSITESYLSLIEFLESNGREDLD